MSNQGATVRVEPVDKKEGAALLNAAAERLLSISGEEFLALWDRGESISDDHVAVMKVAMLIPLAR